MKRKVSVLLEWDGEAHLWVAYTIGFGRLSSFGDTKEHALKMVQEAAEAYIEASKIAGLSLEEPPSELKEIEIPV